MTTLSRRAAGTLAGIAACLSLTTGTASAAVPGGAGEPVPPELAPMLAAQSCGPTATDASIATALNPHLNGVRLRSLDAGEVACARLVTSTVKSRGLNARAATIAVTTAITESTLHDYTESDDHDSLGLFQQRPSQGWGTAAEVIDPVHSTNSFLSAMLGKYPGNSWMSGDIGAICQAVQVSADPGAYDAEAADAQLIVSALWAPASASHVRTGDVNGDGRADLVAIDGDGKIYVYLNKGGSGTSTWGPSTYAGYGWNFRDVEVADVNGDHEADLVAIDDDGKMYVYLNKGGSGTGTWGPSTYAGYGWNFAHVLAGDVDGDGRADLVAIDGDGKMFVYLNKGGSGTSTWGPSTYAGYGWNFAHVLAGDVDGDGRADLVAVDGDGKMFVYLNKGGSGTSTWGPSAYAGYGWLFPGLTAGDATGDGRSDLVAIDKDGKMYVYPNQGGSGTSTWGPSTYAGYGWNAYTY
jgi:hypothetical protein